MAHLVPEPIWNWVSKAWRSMDDLAEKIDDLICSFEGGGDTTMDTVAMYVFGWMLAVLFVLGVGKFVYGLFVERRTQSSEKPATPVTPPVTVSETGAVLPEPVDRPVKPSSLALGGSGPGPMRVTASPAKYVPPTPPVRKRLGSKSGRGDPRLPPPLKSKTNSPAHPPPTATGPESESVRWVNDLFAWLYSDLVIVNELLNVWIKSLNESTKKSVSEHGVGVEFVRVLSESPPPNISNVFCECAPNDDITITCDCETTPALQLKVFRQKGEKVEVSHYRLNVNRFRARLNIFSITEKLLADVKCDGWPEIKVALAQVGAIRSNLDEAQLQDVICEIVTSALRNTDVHLNFSQYPTCPRLLRNVQTPSHLLPVHYDSMLSSQYTAGEKLPEKRLLVKVIKAVGLGAAQGCHEPYCVVEVDEPPQKNQTSIKKETASPVWDEHFLFDVNQNTAEILLEVYDRCRGELPKFLGLGIVSMDELITNPNQRQTISLQTTPHNEVPVSGTLTVEFLLIEGADVPITGDKPFKLKETLRSISPTGAVLTTTKTVFSQPSRADRLTNGGEGVTDSALRELERNRGLTTTQANKSTLIIHSVQRQPQPHVLKVEMTETGKWHEVPEHSQQGIQDISSGQATDMYQQQNMTDPNERGRSRKRKRDFFGTLRRRLNRSKTRSKSAGPPGDDAMQDLVGRSISADRARDPSAHSTGSYLIVPGLEGSERSSLSEASGVSGASSRTYVNEASTLVLETIENGIKKYYLVPLSLAQRSKWKKKGTKLHIFNDHTFIAKHLPGGILCQICKKSLARRLGKQGYECRDCQLKCHKHCHIKADTTCPTSNIQNIELCKDAQSPFSVRKLRKTS